MENKNNPFEKLDASRCLPHGDQLRILLNSDHITYGDVARLARKKGFFNANTEKNKNIPILAASILKPIELVELLSNSTSRELAVKENLDEIELITTNTNWIDPLKSFGDILANKFHELDRPGLSFNQIPHIQFNGRNEASIRYSVNRLDYSQDLLDRNQDFIAEIKIKQEDGKLKLDLIAQHTSKDTYRINQQIVTALTKHFQNEKVTNSDETKKILFGHFSNKNRTTFLLRLAGGFQDNTLPGKILDGSIKRNTRETILAHDLEVKWLDGNVKNIAFDGEQINSIIMLIAEKYYNYFFLTKIKVKHEFIIGTNKGCCVISYGFSRTRDLENLHNCEFSFHIDSLSIDEAKNLKIRTTIREKISSLIRNKVKIEKEDLSIPQFPL
ncbi:hypothetical protein [Chromobacterium subtsugae]|uniref:hypothetical protein n=1 Tax=Chromobacterium subtsugae TaxID=251747 RepID=UPI000ABA6616|nr:hypothetical protein [Chromobacterium subtsugae]